MVWSIACPLVAFFAGHFNQYPRVLLSDLMTHQPRVYQASAAISLCMMAMALCAVMTTFILKLKQYCYMKLRNSPASGKTAVDFLVVLDRFSLVLYACLLFTFLMTATEFNQDESWDDAQYIIHVFAATALFGSAFVCVGIFLWYIMPMCNKIKFEPPQELAMKRNVMIFMGLAIVGSGISRFLSYIFDEANYLLLFGEVAFAFSMGLSPISFLRSFSSEWHILPQSPSNPDLSQGENRKSSHRKSSHRSTYSTIEEESEDEYARDEYAKETAKTNTEEGPNYLKRWIILTNGLLEEKVRTTQGREGEKCEREGADDHCQKDERAQNQETGSRRVFLMRNRPKWCIGVRAGALGFCAFATFVCKVILPCISLADASPDFSYFTDLFGMRGFKSATILLSSVSCFCIFTLFNEHSIFLRKQFPVGVDPLLKLRFARTYDFFLFIIGAILVPSALGVVTNPVGGVFLFAVFFFVSCLIAASTYVSIISPIIIRYNLECHRTAYTKRYLISSLLFIIPVYALCGLVQNWYPVFAKLQFLTNCVLGCMLTLILLSYCQWAAHTDARLPIISFRNLIGRASSGVRYGKRWKKRVTPIRG